MEQGTHHINGMDFSNWDIAEVLIGILTGEGEALDEFLSDYLEYAYAEGHQERPLRQAVNHCAMEGFPEFKILVRIAHSFVLECQRSNYLETGFDSYPSLTVAEFVAEIFRRYA